MICAAAVAKNRISATRITVSASPQKPDFTLVKRFIPTAQWANCRTKAEVIRCAAHSLNFGIYLNDLQVGSARIVTDYIVLAYLMDAFIDRQHRNKGYLRQLMESMIGNPDLKNIKVWKRATSEAHFLYDPAATLVKTRQHDGKVVDRSVIDIIRGL